MYSSKVKLIITGWSFSQCYIIKKVLPRVSREKKLGINSHCCVKNKIGSHNTLNMFQN